MYMMMLVLDDPDKLDTVLDAWREAGIGGATIMESTGYYRRRHAQPIGARYLFGAPRMAEQTGRGNMTLFAIVLNADIVQRCIAATEAVVGNLDDPNTGVFAAWELSHMRGIPTGESQDKDAGA